MLVVSFREVDYVDFYKSAFECTLKYHLVSYRVVLHVRSKDMTGATKFRIGSGDPDGYGETASGYETAWVSEMWEAGRRTDSIWWLDAAELDIWAA